MKTITAVADDLLGPGAGQPATSADGGSSAVEEHRGRRVQDVALIVAIVVTEVLWFAFLAYELWMFVD